MGSVRFGIPKDEVLWLRNMFALTKFVETGTNKADSSVWASEHFEHVVTIEGYEPLFRRAIETYGKISNITFVQGDSPEYLRTLVPTLSSPALFWLDAHWCGPETFGVSCECPVIAELDALNHSSVDHFILIDDARLFLAPPPLPHNADHWPDINAILSALSAHTPQRYTAIHEDVIYSVPAHCKSTVIAHLQSLAKVPQLPQLEPGFQTRIKRRLGRIARRVQGTRN